MQNRKEKKKIPYNCCCVNVPLEISTEMEFIISVHVHLWEE